MAMYTPTEQLLLSVLYDNKLHHAEELLEVVAKSEEDVNKKQTKAKLAVHLCNIRQKMRPTGQDVTAEYVNGETYHRLVCLNTGAYR